MRERATIRAVVAALVAASLVYALPFAGPITRTLGEISAIASADLGLASAWAAAAALVMLGHVIRSWRDTVLFSRAAKTTARLQLGAFAVGQLCSAVLPLKLGELVRADVIAQRNRISFSFSFALVCVERLVDAALLLALSLPIVGFYAPLALIAGVLGLAVWVFRASPRWFKKLLALAGSLLDDRVEARLLFVFWSLEYGLRRTLVPRVMVPYFLAAALNWAVYVAAFAPVLHVATGAGLAGCLSESVGAFVALTTALTPAALGSYSATLAGFGLHDATAYIMLWMAAVVPVAAVGALFAAFKLRDLPLLHPRGAAGPGASDNKLSRNADVSADQLGFLKDYYSGRPLALKVARDEIGGGPAVGRYLSGGGSGAVTYLSQNGGRPCVTKVVPADKSEALRQQYSWLHARRHAMIVEVYGEREDEEAYSIDICYERACLDCFDYVHACTRAERAALLDSVVQAMEEEVWGPGAGLVEVARPDAGQRVEGYLRKHVEGSLALALDRLPSLSGLFSARVVVVNGEECANVGELLGEIRGSRRIMGDLCAFRRSEAIHGDLIVDNVIWSTAKRHPVVLDPVPCGNFFDGPVFDFGKLCQSLWVGYEFMLRDTGGAEVREEGEGRVSVTYADRRSAAYEQMWRHVRDELAPRLLTESERRTMLFIGVTNFLRRMKHQAAQCPANAPAFYAAGVLHLNRYVRMFENGG